MIANNDNRGLWAIGVFGGLVAIGTAVGLYFLLKKGPVDSLTDGKGPGADETPQGKADSGQKPAVDYSNFSVHPNPAFRERNGLILGQAITVKKGANIWRAGVDLKYDIAAPVKTDNRKSLGTIFSLDPTTAVVKAKPGFNSKFYIVKYDDIEEVHKNDII